MGWYSGTEWTNKTANAVVDIDATGKLTLIIDEVTIFNNIQLPADFTNSDKSTWKHVFKSRTGGVNMVHAIDDVKIVEADYSVVTNEYTDNFASTTTLYVVEIDAGGCSSQAVAVTAEIETPLTDGLSNNDFIWTGNTNEIWNTEKNNWLQYTASGFQIPANAPVSTNNVVIRKTDNCYTTIPEIETNTISIGSLKIYGNNELILRNNSKIEINGNMDIESNGILTTNGNTTIECTGSWTNNGTFNAGIGTVILKPTSSINLYPKGVTENKQFYNLTIAGSGTVTLQNHIQINNDFKISSSTFVTGSFNMTVGGNWTRETTAANFNVGSNKTQTVTLTGTGKTIGTYSTTFRNLVIEGSYTLNANISTVQYLNERGDLTIASNASLNANDKQISVGGNWTNNGSFNAGTGLVSFNGSGLQTITSGGSPFNKVWFISNVGFNLTDIMTINGDANFYHGIVNYSPSGALVFGENASSNIGNENSYVDGLITKTGSNAFNFATGQGSYWGPISISDAVSSRTISAIYKHETPPYVNWNPGYMCAGSGLHHVSGVEYWLLESSENDNKQPDVTLYWSDNVESGIEPAYIDKLRVAHWGNNNCWENKGGTASINEGIGLITSTVPFEHYSPITFGTTEPINPLPVELIKFTTECEDANLLVNWNTASEINNDYFEIERSRDALTWKKIAYITGAGNSNIEIDYQYEDMHPGNGTIYYRLLQVDYDNTSKHSTIIQTTCVELVSMPVISVYPNPFKDIFTLQIDNWNMEELEFEISDLLGQKMLVRKYSNIGAYFSTDINLGDLAPAMYMLKVKTKAGVEIRKIEKK